MPDEKASRSRWARVDPMVFIASALLAVFVAIGALALFARGEGAATATVSPAGHHMYAGHITPRPHNGQLTVLVGDYWFKPSARRVRAGVYRLVARNYGVIPHDVMVERTPIRFSAPGVPIDEAAPFGVDDLQPGMTKTTKVMLTPGRWEIFCSVGGHYQAGQHDIVSVHGRMPRGMRAHGPTGMGGSGSGMGMPPS